MTYGIGEWRMRNGDKAIVEHKDGYGTRCLVGTVCGHPRSWRITGHYLPDNESPFDLVASWEEPAPDPIDTEMQAWLADGRTRCRPVLPRQSEAHGRIDPLAEIEGGYEMTEHPMITAIDTALMFDNVPPHITALQWLSNPANVSDDVVDVASEILFNQYYAERYSYEPACFKIDAQTVFTAMINALLKEIEDHEKGGAS